MKIGNITPTTAGYYVQLDNHAPVVIDKTSMDEILNNINRQALSPATATPLPAQVTPGSMTPSSQITPTP